MNRVFKWSYDLLEYGAMLMVVAMTIIISSQVFCRYFLNFTPGWTEEVSKLLLVWITCIGFSVGVYKGLHLSIEIFVKNLPKVVKQVIYFIDECVILFFGYVLVRYGIQLAERMTSSTLPATQWNGSVLYIMVPITGVFAVLYAIRNILLLIKGKEGESQ